MTTEHNEHDRTQFLKLLASFLGTIKESKLNFLKYLPKGNGFTILQSQKAYKYLYTEIGEYFGIDGPQFERKLKAFGFKIMTKTNERKNIAKTIYKIKERFIYDDKCCIDSDSELCQSQDGEDINDSINNEKII